MPFGGAPPAQQQCNILYWGYGPLGRRERSELRAAKPLAQHAVSTSARVAGVRREQGRGAPHRPNNTASERI
jgi:hypothetical protein